MNETVAVQPENDRELVIARLIEATPEALYRCWTDPALIPQWFCPKPWRAEVDEMDVRVGGGQRMTMYDAEGKAYPMGEGVYLALEPGRRLVFTNAMGSGFKPQAAEPFHWVGEITFEPQADGRTLYTARARHWTAEGAKQHAEMGFEHGWGAVAEQLAEVARGL